MARKVLQAPAKGSRDVPARKAKAPKPVEKKEKKQAAPKKAAMGEKVKKHAPYLALVRRAIKAIAARDNKHWVSAAAIAKHIVQEHKLGHTLARHHIRAALARGHRIGHFGQKGQSFCLSAKIRKVSKKTAGKKVKAAKPKKAAVKKAVSKKAVSKKPAAKKAATPKKPAAAAAAPKKRAAPKKVPAKRAPKQAKKAAAAAPAPGIAAPPADVLPQVLARAPSFQAVARPAPGAPAGTFGVVFNTTDIPEVRQSLKEMMGKLLKKDGVSIGIIANRGLKPDNSYNLELKDFSKDEKEISAFVDNAFGEGANWLEYYKQVLTLASSFAWAGVRARNVILIGDAGVGTVSGNAVQAEVGRLNTNNVSVYAFHHSQLELLEEILESLH